MWEIWLDHMNIACYSQFHRIIANRRFAYSLYRQGICEPARPAGRHASVTPCHAHWKNYGGSIWSLWSHDNGANRRYAVSGSDWRWSELLRRHIHEGPGQIEICHACHAAIFSCHAPKKWPKGIYNWIHATSKTPVKGGMQPKVDGGYTTLITKDFPYDQINKGFPLWPN